MKPLTKKLFSKLQLHPNGPLLLDFMTTQENNTDDDYVVECQPKKFFKLAHICVL